jgi:hypothetical protein
VWSKRNRPIRPIGLDCYARRGMLRSNLSRWYPNQQITLHTPTPVRNLAVPPSTAVGLRRWEVSSHFTRLIPYPKHAMHRGNYGGLGCAFLTRDCLTTLLARDVMQLHGGAPSTATNSIQLGPSHRGSLWPRACPRSMVIPWEHLEGVNRWSCKNLKLKATNLIKC